jgi:hypothetical protein
LKILQYTNQTNTHFNIFPEGHPHSDKLRHSSET